MLSFENVSTFKEKKFLKRQIWIKCFQNLFLDSVSENVLSFEKIGMAVAIVASRVHNHAYKFNVFYVQCPAFSTEGIDSFIFFFYHPMIESPKFLWMKDADEG